MNASLLWNTLLVQLKASPSKAATLGVLLLVLVVVVAGQLLAKDPTAVGPDNLRKAGWGLAAIGFVWFVIKADPSGMLSSLGDSIPRPLTLGALALTIGAALATRLMWSRSRNTSI